MAKNYVLNKTDAYALADELNVHLSEHGGTGGGIIGSLAGTGLRLSGNDGRFRGKLQIRDEGSEILVSELLEHPRIDIVKSIKDGLVLDTSEYVRVGDTVKPVLQGGIAVLYVHQVSSGKIKWQTCSKEQIKGY